ncbi:MAG: hypothetical protein Kilf2KO_47810 [Rhodospirillales bacterium]
MASEVAICNQALDRVGAQTIVSLGEESAGAQACARLYPQARDALLTLHDWRFARTRARLALLEAPPPPPWSLVYALPVDCLVARALEGAGLSSVDRATGFAVKGTQLFTDRAEAGLIYTRRIETSGDFAPLYVECLASLLALRLGAALRVDPALLREAQRDYQLALGQARAVDSNQASNRDQPEADWIEARA